MAPYGPYENSTFGFSRELSTRLLISNQSTPTGAEAVYVVSLMMKVRLMLNDSSQKANSQSNHENEEEGEVLVN